VGGLEQPEILVDLETEKTEKPVECLGIIFASEEARRDHFLAILRDKLKDPEFRAIEGFPIGEDEDILAISDPPYYTACPNPFIGDFIEHYGKPYNPETEHYNREPFAADVSEGKNDPIYNAHSYHTKVPHKAIMRYILHYTEPGDIVFDGFCGTGMTGVAAQLCGDYTTLTALGYSSNTDGIINDVNGNVIGKAGVRTAILNDLAPAATLITAGYNLTTDSERFSRLAGQLLDQFETEYAWMYETIDNKTGKQCTINYTVWSEIFTCPNCFKDLEFWSLAYNDESGKVASKTKCPYCLDEVSKGDLIRKTESYYDQIASTIRKRQVLRPVLIDYTCNGHNVQKKPDEADFMVLKRIEGIISSTVFPTDLMMFEEEGKEWGDLYRGYHEGISRVHDFYLPRQLVTFAILWGMVGKLPDIETKRLWHFTLQSVLASFTRRNRFRKQAYSQVNTNLSGTLYVGSTISEPCPRYAIGGKIKRFPKAVPHTTKKVSVTTQSLSSMEIPQNSIDYVFLDPPFGDNLPYAELNFLWESWLQVFTQIGQDVVVNKFQKKNILVYSQLMTNCLLQVYRVLKPGHWVTVEFHNSKNAVWTAIQEALGRAGFIIADIRVLDKGMLTKKQLHANAVNKDLVISAYKPNGGLEERFKLEAGTMEGIWDFIRTHLKQLPVFVSHQGLAEMISERQSYMLYDRMVAFHVQRGVMVPISAAEFYAGLVQRFIERESMYFLPEQAAEYDKKRMTVQEVQQMQLFVCDESSAIQWLRQQLEVKPQTFQDLQPQFMREIGGWQKYEKSLELQEILEQNFLRYDGQNLVPSQIHSYLSTNFKDLRNLDKDNQVLVAKAKDRWYVPDPNKAGDLEKLRERALFKEFDDYRQSTQRKLKVFRLEAVRAGFKKAWQEKDYQSIIEVAAKIPDDVLQEDSKLLMWYDQAITRLGAN